jgi:hypothetical protein
VLAAIHPLALSDRAHWLWGRVFDVVCYVFVMPFVPFGQWVLDKTWAGEPGRLLGGASLVHLQLIWAAITLSVWSATIATYLKMLPSLRARPIAAGGFTRGEPTLRVPGTSAGVPPSAPPAGASR